MTFTDNSGAGTLSFQANGSGSSNLILVGTSTVRMPGLAGAGTRNVVVDAAGNLSAP